MFIIIEAIDSTFKMKEEACKALHAFASFFRTFFVIFVTYNFNAVKKFQEDLRNFERTDDFESACVTNVSI